MTEAPMATCAVKTTDMDRIVEIMSHGPTDAVRDIGRLYMTLHKISIINRAREAAIGKLS